MKNQYLLIALAWALSMLALDYYHQTEKIEKIAVINSNSINVMFGEGAIDNLSREDFKRETGITLEGPVFNPPHETDTQYYAGEILTPDYAHEDTLVVIDPLRLTWNMHNPDMDDACDMSAVLYEYTIPINEYRKLPNP